MEMVQNGRKSILYLLKNGWNLERMFPQRCCTYPENLVKNINYNPSYWRFKSLNGIITGPLFAYYSSAMCYFFYCQGNIYTSSIYILKCLVSSVDKRLTWWANVILCYRRLIYTLQVFIRLFVVKLDYFLHLKVKRNMSIK